MLCCRRGVIWRPGGASSPGRCARARARLRSRPTAPAYPRVLDELVSSGRRGGFLAAAPGRGEPPDPVHLPQRTAAARPVAERPPRASPAARMGPRPARRRPHTRLPYRQMPPAITAKAAATSGHAAECTLGVNSQPGAPRRGHAITDPTDGWERNIRHSRAPRVGRMTTWRTRRYAGAAAEACWFRPTSMRSSSTCTTCVLTTSSSTTPLTT
jgi:hypothetical protein